MPTTANKVTAFTLTAQQGRTPEPLDILGEEVLVKLASADTNNGAAVFHLDVPPMSGPPLHRHSREDEWFYVLDGEIATQIDGQRGVLQSGGSAFAPRGTAHTFQNYGDTTAHLLVVVTPGGFDRFFEEVSAWNKGRPAPDLEKTEKIMNQHGLELLGPPLS